MTVGITNLRLAIVGMAALATVSAALIHNGPGLDDLPVVKEAAPALFGLKDLKLAEVKGEVFNLDTAEGEELATLFAKHFDITADTTEQILEKGVEILMGALPFVLSIFARANLAPAT